MLSAVSFDQEYNNEETSANYHLRPSYPDGVYSKIQEYMKAHGCLSPYFAVDVACGTGHSTLPLAKFCDKVIGFDVSDTQLAYAPKDIPHNVEFRKGDAHNMTSFLEPESVDLVTIAQSFHWLDAEKFFSQVQAVLKPGGVFMNYYSDFFDYSVTPATVNKLINEQFMNGVKKIEEYSSWRQNSDKQQPFHDGIRDTELTTQREYTVPEYIGLMKSFGILTRFSQSQTGQKTFEQMTHALESLLKEEKAKNPDFNGKMKQTLPIYMFIGQKPVR